MTLTIAEIRALGAAVYNFDLMVELMHQVEGVTEDQIQRERLKVAVGKRALKKLRARRKELAKSTGVPE